MMKLDMNVVLIGVGVGLLVCWMRKEQYGCGKHREGYMSCPACGI